jgi:hypothetical protein
MTVVTLFDAERAKLESEVLILAHALVERTEENPAHPAVQQLARRILDTSTRLNP